MGVLEDFLGTYTRSATHRAYAYDINAVVAGARIRNENVAELLSAERIEAHFERERDDGTGAAVLRRRRAVLAAFLRRLRHEDIARLPRSIAAVNRVPGGMSGSAICHPVLDREDVEALLGSIDRRESHASRDRSLILTIYYCCLRRAELARMDVEHIHGGDSPAYVDIPGNADRDPVSACLPAEPLHAIQSMISEYEITRGPLWRSFSNNSRGRRLSPRSIYNVVHRTAVRAGFDDSVNADTLRYAGLVRALGLNLADLEKPFIGDGTIHPWTLVENEEH